MNTGCRTISARRRTELVGVGVALGMMALGVLARAQEDADAPKLDEVTREQLLTKVPNFFSFDYPFQPQPGKRLWLRIDDKHWIERYPDGFESRYETLGRATVRDQSGTVVEKIEGDPEKTLTENDKSFQVFIPDKGTDLAILFRNVVGGTGVWRDMSWSENRKTTIQSVE